MGILPILLGILLTDLLFLNLRFLQPRTLRRLPTRLRRLSVVRYRVLVRVGLCE